MKEEKMKTLENLILLSCFLAIVILGQSTLAGPIILSGTDPEDHRFEGEPEASASLQMIQDIMLFIHDEASNGGAGILMLGGSENSTVYQVALEAATNEGFSLDHAFGDNIKTVDFTGYAALYMPTVSSELDPGYGNQDCCGLTVEDLNKINGRGDEIVLFVNSGGGLGAFSQNEPNGYGWFPMDGLETTDLGGFGEYDICMTLEGYEILASSATAVEPFHTTFDGPLGFFGLDVLARNDTIIGAPCGGPAIIIGGLTSIVSVEESDELQKPRTYVLSQNSPNPFTNTTTIRYQLPVKSRVSLKIFDLTGRLVRTLKNVEEEGGFYTVNWDGRDDWGRELVNSVYFYRIQTIEYNEVKKLIMLR